MHTENNKSYWNGSYSGKTCVFWREHTWFFFVTDYRAEDTGWKPFFVGWSLGTFHENNFLVKANKEFRSTKVCFKRGKASCETNSNMKTFGTIHTNSVLAACSQHVHPNLHANAAHLRNLVPRNVSKIAQFRTNYHLLSFSRNQIKMLT